MCEVLHFSHTNSVVLLMYPICMMAPIHNYSPVAKNLFLEGPEIFGHTIFFVDLDSSKGPD